MLKEELLNLGLTDPEVNLYIAGIELGPASVMELAKKIGVNRTTLYHTMQSMLMKKLFLETVKGKKRVFVPEGPEALKAMLLNKIVRVENIAGELLALARTGTIKPVVKMYTGLSGIKDVFHELLHCKESTMCAWSGVEHMNVTSKALQEFWMNDYAPLRIKYKKFAKLIMPDTPAGKLWKATDKDKYRETRLLPSSTYNFPGEIIIIDNKVASLVYSDKEQFAVVIESASIAETLRMIFAVCWGQGY